MQNFLPVILILILIAGLLRADKVLIVLYLLAILYLGSRWWSRSAIRNLKLERDFQKRAFLEQNVPVSLKIINHSILPIVWLQLHESLPVEMIVPGHYSEVVSLGSRKTASLSYSIQPHKRGYYPIGPAYLSSGDPLGMNKEDVIEIPPDNLTVYPRIVPIKSLGLPSNSMFGSIREKNPIFEDPTRIFGKRRYVNGDSLRKVDWKTSASTGILQVKQFEASKSLELAIFLDLNISSYDFVHHIDQTELAIIAAASISNWAVKQKYAIGLATNGIDPFGAGIPPDLLNLRKGNAQLMQVLEILARISAGDVYDFAALINRFSVHLPWGVTAAFITGTLPDTVLDEMIRARRRGLNISLFNIGAHHGLLEAQQRARQSGFTVYQIHTIVELEQVS